MIGVDAISAGFLGFLIFAGLSGLSIFGLVAGIVLFLSGRTRGAKWLIGVSTSFLAGVAVLAFSILHVPRHALQVDLTQGHLSRWEGDLLSCQEMPSEKLCFPQNGRYTLSLKLPDLANLTLEGEQLFFRVDEHSQFNGLDIVLKPEPTALELEALVSGEESKLGTSRFNCGQSRGSGLLAAFKQWAANAKDWAQDNCRLEFQHHNYSTSYEISPSTAGHGTFFVGYRIILSEPEIVPSTVPE